MTHCKISEEFNKDDMRALIESDLKKDLHMHTRFSDGELTPQELNLEKFQGIRPAVGYPSLPDQSIIFSIDKILSLDRIGITLTANGAMFPHAAVCGMMISHSAARYFAIGNITDEQLADYAARRSMPVEKIQKFLIKNIG